MASIRLGTWELSAIKEMANVGVGGAATSLSQLTGLPFSISVPATDPVCMEEIPDLLGGPETPTVAVAMEVEGDLSGILVFVLTAGDASRIADVVLPNVDAAERAGLEQSLYMEIGNIVDSGFLNAVSEMTNTKTVAGVPILISDMAATVVQGILGQAYEHEDRPLVIETRLECTGWDSFGLFAYIPAKNSLAHALRGLGVEVAA